MDAKPFWTSAGGAAQDVGFRLGLALVLGLMIFATWNDLVR